MMIMLREYLSADELEMAVLDTDVAPELLFIHYSIRTFMDQLRGGHIRVFSYPFKQPTYWFVVDLKKNAAPSIHAAQQGDIFDSQIFVAGLKLLMDEIRALSGYKTIEFTAEAQLVPEILALLPQFLPHHDSSTREDHTVFFMSEEQMQNALKVDVSLPYGYYFSELELSDAKEIKQTTQSEESVALLSERIAYLPSICIRQNVPTSPVVSHEMTSASGSMISLYTSPDHRRQGLGSAAELKLAQKLISNGSTPFKAVPNYLTSILLSSEASPFWTVFTRQTLPVQLAVLRLQMKN